jgi:hypothetical protein
MQTNITNVYEPYSLMAPSPLTHSLKSLKRLYENGRMSRMSRAYSHLTIVRTNLY